MSKNRVIGVEGRLPWSIPEDMRRFKQLTSGCSVIMGRKTFESLPGQFRPLPNRRNIVVSRDPRTLKDIYSDQIELFSSPEEAISECRKDNKSFRPPIWVIGGAEIYKATLKYTDDIYLTLVDREVDGDAYFPRFEDDFILVDNEQLSGFSFRKYSRRKEPLTHMRS